MKQKLIPSILVFTLALSILSACSPSAELAVQSSEEAGNIEDEAPVSATTDEEAAPSENITIIDLLGREVEVPSDVSRVVAIGPGALRLYVYASNLDYLVGVEQMETDKVTGKPYMLANPDLASLPVIGQGGPNNAPDPEKLVSVETQVIFSTYASEVSAADELQKKTGIPVVCLNYGGFGITTIFGENIQKSLVLIGQITGENCQSSSGN